MAKNETSTEQERVLSEYEQVELEFKREQIAEMRAKREERENVREKRRMERERLVRDIKENEVQRLRRQARCKHRKGGKNNNFAGGDANYRSIVRNIYPCGCEQISCTRCGSDVWKPLKRACKGHPQTPSLELKKDQPKVYAEALAKWKEWSEYPTDNEPSGSQVFLIESAA